MRHSNVTAETVARVSTAFSMSASIRIPALRAPRRPGRMLAKGKTGFASPQTGPGVHMQKPAVAIVVSAVLSILAGCSVMQPDLSRIYAKQEGDTRQPPVVVIHGALGGRLHDRELDREIWPGSIRRVVFSDYEDLMLEIDEDTLKPRVSRLTPTGVARVVGGVDFYGRILEVLDEAGGFEYSEPGEQVVGNGKRYYVFSYDWRQDNVETVRRLDAFIDRIRADYGDPALEVDIVAHSMGGLITRYFIRYGTVDVLDDNDFPVNQQGAAKIRRVVLLGTPNLGSAAAFRTLARGYKLLLGTIPIEVVATFPSTYQVLPHAINDWLVDMDGAPMDFDQFDTEFWREIRFSIFDPRVEDRIRRRFDSVSAADRYIATLHRYFEKHIERARRFSWSLTVPANDLGIEYIVFGSDCVDTPARMVVEDVDGARQVRLYPKEIRNPRSGVNYERIMLEPGDGVVTKASLMARQTFDPTVTRHQYSFFPMDYPIFLCETHSHLTGNIHFQNNLLHALLSVDR